MSDKKNIDRLFQEKFNDFEANPAEDLWANIEAKLDDKKRRRVIPLWWKLSGVAAIFLIGFWVGQAVFNNDVAPTNPVVIENNSNQTNGKVIDANSENNNTNGINPKLNTNPDNAISEKEATSNDVTPKSANTANVVDNKTNISSQKPSAVKSSSTMVNASKSGIAQGKSSKHRSAKDKSNSDKNKANVSERFEQKDTHQMAVNTGKRNQAENQPNPIAETNINKTNDANSLQINKDLTLDGLKGNNNSEIAVKETDNKSIDTTLNNSVAKNELEELLNKKEDKLKQESKLNRWQLTSNVAPIFLGSASNGSPIDSTLVNNSKSYNTGVGFGIGVSYAISKKLTIRTGLNKFNMSYNTNDIVYFAGLDSRSLKHINATASASRIQIEDDVPATASAVPSETGLLPFENSFVHKNKGYINQEMGYLEMPVEMTYALLDKKFGIRIIGGFSTLLLQDNVVNVVSDNRSTFLGEADNLNNIHFSTNFGIGLNYAFLKSFEFNVEPTFKYQLNTFSSDAGNFKPYVFGIYSGISYKF